MATLIVLGLTELPKEEWLKVLSPCEGFEGAVNVLSKKHLLGSK